MKKVIDITEEPKLKKAKKNKNLFNHICNYFSIWFFD